MRITQNMSADNALYNIQKGRTKLDRLQEQLSTQQNFLRPSDDPITTRYILDLENRIKESDQYMKNIQNANIWMNVTNTALTGISDTIKSVRGVIASVSKGADNSPEGISLRNDAISQLKEWRKMLIDLGNTKVGDQFVFAGFNNNVQAFGTSALSSPPLPAGDPLIGEPAGTWQGTSDEIQIDIGNSSRLGINVAGDAIYNGMSNGATPGPYGGLDIIATIDDVIRAIDSNNTAQIQADENSLYNATGQLNNAIGDVASKLLRSQSAEKLLLRSKNTALDMIANRQNVDLAKVATELTQEKTAFEATLSSTAKISQLSLLDYLN